MHLENKVGCILHECNIYNFFNTAIVKFVLIFRRREEKACTFGRRQVLKTPHPSLK